ncbi:unnamed protein product [Polarella glacialis]|uniref:alpha-amylase n=2 Tax=Polarella glacialis TaxID=89957 RepID=A0A813E7W6_POLGL|nr:unnamed protein product [Polarella glacialis]
MNMLLFSVNALSGAIGAPIWALLARRVQPRRLLAAALLLQIPLLLTAIPIRQPTVSLAVALIFLQGLAGSGSLMFICFNFMMSIKADMSHAALRMGFLEMLRYCVTWLLTSYVFVASPSTVVGTAEAPLPAKVYWLLAPVAAVALCTTLVPGVLCLFAPGPYREDRFPGWDFHLLGKRKVFLLLGLSDIIGALALFPGTCYVSWWLANGWTSESLAWISVIFAVLLAVSTLLWSLALSRAVVHGFSFLIGVTLLLAPASILRAVVQEEVSTFTFLGRSDVAVSICLVSLIAEGIRGSAIWAVKVRVLNSRWRLLSYGSLLLSCQSLAAMLSPFLCEWIARMHSGTFISANQKELADATVVTIVPLCLLQFIVQMLTAPYIREELGLASSGSLNRGRGANGVGGVGAETASPSAALHSARSCWRVREMLPFLALGAGVGLVIAVVTAEQTLIRRPLPFSPLRRCLLGGMPLCKRVVDEIDPRQADFTSPLRYGPNKFGQSTTGKFNCAARMKHLGGDTFAFWPYGRCQVWQCGKAAFRNARVAFPLDKAEVWSHHCSMSGQGHILVHLFEWRWPDVARECEDYLGPSGFTAVQVSPPMEHVLGESWATRYQPVSYRLDSRGGNTSEFVGMVARCRNAGVAVMVDVILNHMAAPVVQSPTSERGKECGGSENTSETSTLPCLGWSGTVFGNRQFLHGTPGYDYYDRKDFHHYQGNERSNCGLPPWTNNRHLCDLTGLVDLDTENVDVQRQLQLFLKALYEVGVTMLRLDAAMHMYPESIAEMLEPFPFEYVVQEFYPPVLKFEHETMTKAIQIGSLTSFDIGQQIAQVIFDSWDSSAKAWRNRSAYFKGLLQIGQNSPPDCQYAVCGSPYPPEKSLMFLDNHDQQRQRWKPEKGGPPPNPLCQWDGTNTIGDCRPIYKHGLEYHLAQRFLLAWPYGDAVRIMSSFSFSRFDQGPPGVKVDSLHDMPTTPVNCRATPDRSPVSTEYDDDVVRPWVCEHRWTGMSGLVRLRRLTGTSYTVSHTFSDDQGHVAFGIGRVAFVALNRGFNWMAKQGSNKSWDLVGLDSGLPHGVYCDLAQEPGPVPDPSRWNGTCVSRVVVSPGGLLANTQVSPAGVLAIHVAYQINDEKEVDQIVFV